jgi:hypothetical protein
LSEPPDSTAVFYSKLRTHNIAWCSSSPYCHFDLRPPSYG